MRCPVRGLRIALLAAATSTNTRSWVASLTSKGHQVEVVTFHGDSIPGAPVHLIQGVELPAKLQYLVAVPRVRRILRQIAPDLVIGYYLSSYGLVAALAWEGPLVLTAAGSDILRPGSRPAKILLRYLALRGDLFIAWAGHMAKHLKKLGVAPHKLLVVHRGVDDTVFQLEGKALCSSARYVLVSTRNLKPIYDLETSIRAVGVLVEKGYDVEYRILGQGPLRGSLECLAQELELFDRVTFLGHQPPVTVASHLRSAQVYISTTHSDGASSSLFEAMACGAFPVVSHIPANREWIQHGVNGYLVRIGDVEGFAEAVAMALDSQNLRVGASRMNAGIVRDKLDPSKNLDLMTARFQGLLQSDAPPRSDI